MIIYTHTYGSEPLLVRRKVDIGGNIPNTLIKHHRLFITLTYGPSIHPKGYTVFLLHNISKTIYKLLRVLHRKQSDFETS